MKLGTAARPGSPASCSVLCRARRSRTPRRRVPDCSPELFPRRQGGFTLLEMLISLLVLGLVLLIASRLLGESGRVLAYSVGRARNPQWTLALEQLRNDVRSSSVGGISAPNSGPLVLPGADATVLWRLRGDRLLREVSRPEEEPVARVALSGVTLWLWSRPDPGLVEMWVVGRRQLEPFLRLVTSPLPRHAASEIQAARLVVAPRNARPGSGW